MMMMMHQREQEQEEEEEQENRPRLLFGNRRDQSQQLLRIPLSDVQFNTTGLYHHHHSSKRRRTSIDPSAAACYVSNEHDTNDAIHHTHVNDEDVADDDSGDVFVNSFLNRKSHSDLPSSTTFLDNDDGDDDIIRRGKSSRGGGVGGDDDDFRLDSSFIQPTSYSHHGPKNINPFYEVTHQQQQVNNVTTTSSLLNLSSASSPAPSFPSTSDYQPSCPSSPTQTSRKTLRGSVHFKSGTPVNLSNSFNNIDENVVDVSTNDQRTPTHSLDISGLFSHKKSSFNRELYATSTTPKASNSMEESPCHQDLVNRMNTCLSLNSNQTITTNRSKPVEPSTPTHPSKGGRKLDCPSSPVHTQTRSLQIPNTPLPIPPFSQSITSMMVPMNSIIQSKLDAEFEVIETIGKGSFGTVYKVAHRLDGCFYAVKVMNSALNGRRRKARALQELFALSALSADNQHIVGYHQAWIEHDKLYIQIELCDMSLDKYFKIQNPENYVSVAIDILRQILDGLKYLHASNVVHLDIKAANILVKNGTFKLGDLGHASIRRSPSTKNKNQAPPIIGGGQRRESDDSMQELHPLDDTSSEAGFGSVSRIEDEFFEIEEGDSRYLAPELLNGLYSEVSKSDIFSLGATIYELFLGRELPANGPEWEDIRNGNLDENALAKMSPPLRVLIQLMMHPNHLSRPSAENLLKTGGPERILCSSEEVELMSLRDQLRTRNSRVRRVYTS